MLVDQYKTWIYTYAYYFLAREEDAQDVCQNVLIRLWKNIDCIQSESIKAWLRRTTRNACIDIYRRNKRSNTYIDSMTTDELDNRAASDNNPFEYAHGKTLETLITSALQQLSEKQKSVVIMRDIQDMPYRHIAKFMNLPLGTVKVLVMRGRRKLREQLINKVKGSKDVKIS